MHEITISADDGDYLKLSVICRSHPDKNDYWDGNWLRATVDLRAGGFRGTVEGDIRADEIAGFLVPLWKLHQSLQGIAQFETLETWLSLRATGDGCGHIDVECEILDQPGIGNRLVCTLKSDQTYIKNTIAELAAAVEAFPVIGRP